MGSQARSVTAGAFHRPRPDAGVPGGEFDQLGVAGRVCADGGLRQNGSGSRGDDRGGVGVLMRVDADDDLDQLCEHGQPRSP